MSARYWEYAIDYAMDIKNRVPHSAIGISRYDKLTGKRPNLKYAHPFRCAAFVYTETPKSKLHARAHFAIMLGCNDHGVYTIEKLTDEKITNSVYGTFD